MQSYTDIGEQDTGGIVYGEKCIKKLCKMPLYSAKCIEKSTVCGIIRTSIWM